MSRLRRLGVLGVCLLVTACTGDATVTTTSTASPSTSAPATTAPPEPTTTQPASTTSVVPESTTTTTGTSTSTEALPPFPPERTDLTHGGDAWAVVLAANEDGNAPDLLAAIAAAEDAGYVTGVTDCDFGAAEALGLPAGSYYTVSVYLQSEADANAALAAFEARGVDGAVGLVQTFCLD